MTLSDGAAWALAPYRHCLVFEDLKTCSVSMTDGKIAARSVRLAELRKVERLDELMVWNLESWKGPT